MLIVLKLLHGEKYFITITTRTERHFSFTTSNHKAKKKKNKCWVISSEITVKVPVENNEGGICLLYIFFNTG